MFLKFTIDSSFEIHFNELFRLRRALLASIRASGFHACLSFGLRFKLGGNFGLQASKSSAASSSVFDFWH